jgi:hypothetical protein
MSRHFDWESAYLAIVESALNGNIVYVGIKDCGHLSLLDRADLALGVHDEHANILLTAQTVNGRRASVTTGCTDNGQVFSVLALLLLALVSANEEVLEEVAQELQSNILESESWAVEQLQQVEVLVLVEGCDGTNVVGPECSIALSDDLLEVCFGDLVARDVEGEDLKGEILEGKVAPFGLPVGRQGRDVLGDEQAAVFGETLQDDILEGKLIGFSA